jgi:tRNA (mo5U34)-methyltransferase
VAGFRVTVGADERRVRQIKSSAPYRYLVAPLLAGRKGGASRNGAAHRKLAFDPETLSEEGKAIWEEVSKLKWYQSIDLGHGVVTPGFVDRRSVVARYGLPDDLSGKRALDVGTYDGFWAFEMERRGAAVVAIDVDSIDDHDIPRRGRLSAQEVESRLQRAGAQLPGEAFRLAKKVLGSRVERKAVNVYKLAPEDTGMVDFAFISEVLLHLRDPQTALEKISSVLNPGGTIIVAETYQPDLEEFGQAVSEFKGASFWGIWWGHSPRTLRTMMEVAGFEQIEEVSRMHLTNRSGEFDKVVLRGQIPRPAVAS